MMKKIILFLFASFLIMDVKADSWPLPTTEIYYNQNRTFYVKIYPQHIPEKYWKWLSASPKKKKKFQPKDTLVIPCYAQFYKVIGNKDSLIWEQQLINKVAPLVAIISNDGRFLVTFDNWSSLGYGIDVMVYYNEKGELIKRHKLEEISPFPINTYYRSISSLWWRCGQDFLDNHRISICFTDKNKVVKDVEYNLLNQKMQTFARDSLLK